MRVLKFVLSAVLVGIIAGCSNDLSTPPPKSDVTTVVHSHRYLRVSRKTFQHGVLTSTLSFAPIDLDSFVTAWHARHSASLHQSFDTTMSGQNVSITNDSLASGMFEALTSDSLIATATASTDTSAKFDLFDPANPSSLVLEDHFYIDPNNPFETAGNCSPYQYLGISCWQCFKWWLQGVAVMFEKQTNSENRTWSSVGDEIADTWLEWHWGAYNALCTSPAAP
jgi:hypothetical protein